MKVFEYVDQRGRGVFSEWYDKLQKREQAALDAKLDTVRGAELEEGKDEIPPNLFRGPVKYEKKFYPNTFKLTANAGNVALRPLACKGPIDRKNEWTILLPVIEVGNKYPPGVFAEAERRRSEIIADPQGRRRELVEDDEHY